MAFLPSFSGKLTSPGLAACDGLSGPGQHVRSRSSYIYTIVHFLEWMAMNYARFKSVFMQRFSFAGALALALSVTAAQDVWAARIVAINGKLTIERGDKTLNAAVGTRLRQGDAVSSDANSEALMRFTDGARLALRAESRVEVETLKLTGEPTKRQKTIKILKGGLRYVSGVSPRGAAKKGNVTFTTNTATIGIRGTDIEIAVSPDVSSASSTDPAGTYLKVNRGLATLAAVDGTQVDVDPGQIAFGGLPELVPRGAGSVARPAARKVSEPSGGLFKTGGLDRLLR